METNSTSSNSLSLFSKFDDGREISVIDMMSDLGADDYRTRVSMPVHGFPEEPFQLYDAEVDDSFLAETTPSLDPTPRRRRAIAQPVRLDNNVRVACYLYSQTKACTSRWQGHTARLCYFLPQNWSPAYKFTVFEDSYIVRIDDDVDLVASTDSSESTQQYHLARPLHTRKCYFKGGEELAEFELVWPMNLDRMLLDTVHRACDTVHPGAKRKPRHTWSITTVHHKLQKLDL